MQKKVKHKRRTAGPVAAAVLIIVAAAGLWLVQRYTPTKERMEAEAYFGALAEDEIAIVLQDELAAERGILENGALYLDYGMVRDRINSRFYWDEGENRMLFTTALETYEIPVDSAGYTVDESPKTYERPILLSREGGLYLSVDFLAQFTNLEYVLETETKHALIRYQWGTMLTGALGRDTAVRYQGGIKSPILTDGHQGDLVYVLEEMENWSKVLTGDGYIGYVPNKRLESVEGKEITREFQEPVYTDLTKEERVRVVWHQIDNPDSNTYLKEDIARMTGVDVISPTWFSVADNEGNINSLASEEYVKEAHGAGLEIWGLVNNFSADVDTTTLLASTAARRKMVDYLTGEAVRLGLEGINLDFEYIREEAGYSYAQFVRELSIGCRKHGLVLSVDVPVPMDFNRQYSRKELGAVADYVIVMGYDEHYAGSETAGSVASLSFEENGIKEMLKEVPARKIISGVPFYTRIWYTVDNGDGTASVTSEAIGMDTVDRTLETYGVTPQWNEETAQYYAAWTLEDGTRCEIWIEEEESLAKKARLVDQYDLGGIAAWVLGFERDSVWEVLEKNAGGKL